MNMLPIGTYVSTTYSFQLLYNYYIVQIHPHLFNHSLIVEHLGCFWYFSSLTVKRTSLSIYSQVLLFILVLDRCLKEILGQRVCTFNILINVAKLPSQKLGLVYNTAHMKTMFFPHFSSCLLFSYWITQVITLLLTFIFL